MPLLKRFGIAVLVCFPLFSYAKGTGMINRGGYGFLSPDNNDFINNSELSMAQGLSLEGDYSRVNGAGNQLQTAMPSAVWGNGRFGIGGYGLRLSPDLASSKKSLDVMGGGLGFNFADGRLSLGGGYSRPVSANPGNEGTLDAEFTLNPKGHGISLGIGGSSTSFKSASSLQTATGAIGWMFAQNNVLEADFKSNDTKNSKDYTLSGNLNLGNQRMFFGGGYSYYNVGANNFALARVGVIFNQRADLAAHVGSFLKKGAQIIYGGSFRVTL